MYRSRKQELKHEMHFTSGTIQGANVFFMIQNPFCDGEIP